MYLYRDLHKTIIISVIILIHDINPYLLLYFALKDFFFFLISQCFREEIKQAECVHCPADISNFCSSNLLMLMYG